MQEKLAVSYADLGVTITVRQGDLTGATVSSLKCAFRCAGVASLREMKKVRQRADTLNAALRTNGCATIDIDQALKISVAPRLSPATYASSAARTLAPLPVFVSRIQSA